MHTPPTKFSTLVRVGFAARAVLYMMLGYIGLTSAGHLQQGTDGIFVAIRELPLGTALLWLMVLGFTFYGLFRLASATFDIENHGSDKRGLATRAGHGASGLGHLALAFTAYGFATYDSAGGSAAQEAAAGLLGVTLGGTVLGLLGLCFFGAAAQQAREAISGSFMADIARDAPEVTRSLGTIGYLARAVVFAIIGWSLIDAGWLTGSSARVKTLGEAVQSLSGMDPWFTLVSIGLLLFGLFSLILARFRIIPEVDMRTVRSKRRGW
ncbi:DUF1206 domain-containing protein [Alteraurantiacibacter buctensis]|uniref:DUF1206 domain-containing protein n=1 Tax=Alteraurantiacibacter buctensis TaxID=1503981 RepID=A0A844YYV7_9SPHN|nr:DUF1206 domain-containing protein [Alteraurantiacibacter buctensis]MXO72140.1 DUF1206 domain-containing protein [Alteraurantiacibacter buctensis]